MNDYEIITRTYWKRKPIGAKSTFLTRGKNIKSALRNLINRSWDFKTIIKDEKEIQITIKRYNE